MHSELTKECFAGNSSAVTTQQATKKKFLRMTRGTVQIQTPGMTEIKAYQREENVFFYSSKAKAELLFFFRTLNPQRMGLRGILKVETIFDVL